MSSKYLFVLILTLILSAGCNILDRSAPNVVTTPPYWQLQGGYTQSQFDEMRAFHEKESAKMSEDMHVFRNREMERLATAGKELEIETQRQEGDKKAVERREKWTSWFNKKGKENENPPPLVSETNNAVR